MERNKPNAIRPDREASDRSETDRSAERSATDRYATDRSAIDRPAVDRPTSEMTGQGQLVFQITTASGAIPLEGAEIILRKFKSPADSAEEGEVVAVLYSGEDGKTRILPLPAPARSLSLKPALDGAPAPYALYDAEVNLENYFSQSYIRIPVFDGVTSIQRASLVPLPESGYSQGLRPDGDRFFEGEGPNL